MLYNQKYRTSVRNGEATLKKTVDVAQIIKEIKKELDKNEKENKKCS